MKATQKTIAARLGVSISLVSRALSGTASAIGASEETVRRIVAEAGRLKYSPNSAALTLRGRRSGTVGVLVKDFDDPFFGTMISCVQGGAVEHSFSLLLAGFDGSGRPDLDSLSRLNLDILVLCGSDVCGPWIRNFIANGVACVQIGEGRNFKGLARVSVDDRAGIRLLLEHLLDLGHRRFSFVGTKSMAHLRRRNCLEDELGSRKERFLGLEIVPAADCIAGVPEVLRNSLSSLRKRGTTAIFAADDLVGFEVLKFLRNSGFRVPEDFSVLGFDNLPFSSRSFPTLTSVGVDFRKMVSKAFEIAIAGRRTGKAGNVLFAPVLESRQSSGEANIKNKERRR